MLSVGLMSGTSMDGIDAALLETDGTPQLIRDKGHIFIPYDPRFTLLLKAAEYAVRKYQGDLIQASQNFSTSLQSYIQNALYIPLDHIAEKIEALYAYGPRTVEQIILHSTELHAIAVKKLLAQENISASKIDVVGYHGQTLFHQPKNKISIIIGDGQYLANLLNIKVVNDFRRQDILAGGQGAPFAPLYHQALAIQSNKIPLAVVNCGGIANVTLIHSENILDIKGFDTGPGNALLDSLIRKRTQGQAQMDVDGKYGQKGRVHDDVILQLYAKSIIRCQQNYFDNPAPKSLDYNDIIPIPELESLSIEDACRTLAAFTADSIITSVEKESATLPHHWILAGGGWKNPVITSELTQRLIQKLGNHLTIQLAEEAGWNNQAMEAQIFAYFAVRSLYNLPLSVPGTTQVPYPLCGGYTHIPNTI